MHYHEKNIIMSIKHGTVFRPGLLVYVLCMEDLKQESDGSSSCPEKQKKISDLWGSAIVMSYLTSRIGPR